MTLSRQLCGTVEDWLASLHMHENDDVILSAYIPSASDFH